tara:strand:+ start:18444 stop:20060 length:1617 start_codon:yes stop_codon:yes gene_type:complete
MLKANIVKEIIACGKSPDYFINKYIKVEHPLKGVIPFKLYDYQADILKDFLKNRFNIINKGRQLGLSTLLAAYCTWMMLFYKNKNILVVATKIDVAKNIIDKVKIALNNLPEDMFIAKITVNNRHSIELSNGSRIKASTTAKDVGRSEAASFLIVDEAAHVDDLESLWTGLKPTMARGGRCALVSTPNGVGNFFHKTYSDAEANINDFKARTIDWRVHPEQDDKWFAKETRGFSQKKIDQEYEAKFIASGDTVVEPEDINYLEAMVRLPIERMGIDRNLWIWEFPITGEDYIISADVARGDGSDCSTLHCLKVSSWEIVAEYKGKLPPEIHGRLLDEAGRMYNDALMVPENNSFGYTTIQKLIEANYPNLYIEGNRGRRSSLLNSSLSVLVEENNIPGFTTSVKTRPLILSKLEEVIRTRTLKCYSSRFVDELKSFRWIKGKAKAQKGMNDDLVISMAIACWMSDATYTVNERARNLNSAMLDAMTVSSRNWDNARGTGKDIVPTYNNSMLHGYSAVDLKVRSTAGEEIDLSWLISMG